MATTLDQKEITSLRLDEGSRGLWHLSMYSESAMVSAWSARLIRSAPLVLSQFRFLILEAI